MADSDSEVPEEESSRLMLGASERNRTAYGSDGELERISPTSGEARRRVAGGGGRSTGEEEEQVVAINNDGDGSAGGDGSTPRAEGDSEETDTQCGLLYCGRKLLNLLPAIGEGEDEGTVEFEEELRFGAWQVIQLIIPVTICMAVVVFFQLTIASSITGPVQQPLYLIAEKQNNGLNFLIGIANALIFVVIIVVMTTLLVILFKYRCYRAISVWLVTASGILLFIISSIYFIETMSVQKLVIDWFTFAFIIWNFGVMGLMVIHWKGPLRLQQAYLILVSALVATTLIQHLPNWTTWILLVAISIYDLFAVLCPKGPLRILVDTAKERGGAIFPSLIYSSTMVWIGMADVEDKKAANKRGKLPKGRPQRTNSTSSDNSEAAGSESDEDSDRVAAVRVMGHPEPSPDALNAATRVRQGNRQQREGDQEEEEEEEEEARGFKLGLGDFIFYSVLVGKAAHVSNGDWVIISSCFVAILIGLCLTSLILGIVRRALPALPISIFFGLVFYFTSQHLIAPFVEVLNTQQVFI